ncbi:Cell division protein FtsW [Anaerovibrio sp. JC8]|uniref:FtsW/RodA/SpoVE family cell cycle protein n=1 Tax=Anaerovibrio sp. JC8 TaxID=1240085 RepID=UPI000A0E9085|nr:putative peptidoglycan glycosyltransferase FtsW [Anaerovibrio sp. JC8]ORU00914.1 Cell division protein FtsW [Anaerovibrio sp. JC8]
MSKIEPLARRQGVKLWKNNHEAVMTLVIILLIAGLFNVFSSTFVMAERDYGSPYAFLIRHAISMVLGLLACFVGARVDYHKWRSLIMPVTGIIVVALVVVLLFTAPINGARRWISLPGFSFQPAEFAKLVSIMLAGYYISFRNGLGKELNLFNRQLAVVGLMALLVYVEPDMGTACIVMGIPIIMMVVGGLHFSKIKWLVLGAFILVGVMIYMQPYRLERLMVTYDPWPYEQDQGYQTVRSLMSIGSGGLFGMGIGEGLSKYDYLPEAHTDFAFAVFSQEMGFFVVLGILIVYMMFCRYAASIAKQAQDMYGQMLAVGILLLIGGQAVANLIMVSGMIPVVGVPLPFISYGGTSLVMSLFAVGIMVNISRQTVRIKERDLIREALKKEPHLIKRPRPNLRRVK